MQLSECGVRFITEFEGFVDHVYDDGVGVATIGFGTTDPAIINAYRGRTCTREEAMGWLRSDIDRKYGAAVNTWMHSHGQVLPQHRFDCLTSFSYNLGVGIIQRATSSLRQALDSGGDVPAAIRLYDKAGSPSRALAGLTRRRGREAAMWNGDYGFECAPATPTRRKGDDVPQICAQPGETVVLQYEEAAGLVTLASAMKKGQGDQIVEAAGANVHIECTHTHDAEPWWKEDLWVPQDNVGRDLPGNRGGTVLVVNKGPNVCNVFVNYSD